MLSPMRSSPASRSPAASRACSQHLEQAVGCSSAEFELVLDLAPHRVDLLSRRRDFPACSAFSSSPRASMSGSVARSSISFSTAVASSTRQGWLGSRISSSSLRQAADDPVGDDAVDPFRDQARGCCETFCLIGLAVVRQRGARASRCRARSAPASRHAPRPAPAAARRAARPASPRCRRATARVRKALTSSRGSDRSTCCSTRPRAGAMLWALPGSASQRAIQPAISTSRMRSAEHARRQEIVGDEAADARRRCAPCCCGTIAVCGIGRPSGWRNSATTANQSAQAPIMPASAKARR